MYPCMNALSVSSIPSHGNTRSTPRSHFDAFYIANSTCSQHNILNWQKLYWLDVFLCHWPFHGLSPQRCCLPHFLKVWKQWELWHCETFIFIVCISTPTCRRLPNKTTSLNNQQSESAFTTDKLLWSTMAVRRGVVRFRGSVKFKRVRLFNR